MTTIVITTHTIYLSYFLIPIAFIKFIVSIEKTIIKVTTFSTYFVNESI